MANQVPTVNVPSLRTSPVIALACEGIITKGGASPSQ